MCCCGEHSDWELSRKTCIHRKCHLLPLPEANLGLISFIRKSVRCRTRHAQSVVQQTVALMMSNNPAEYRLDELIPPLTWCNQAQARFRNFFFCRRNREAAPAARRKRVRSGCAAGKAVRDCPNATLNAASTQGQGLPSALADSNNFVNREHRRQLLEYIGSSESQSLIL